VFGVTLPLKALAANLLPSKPELLNTHIIERTELLILQTRGEGHDELAD